MKEALQVSLDGAIAAVTQLKRHQPVIEKMAALLIDTYRRGNKVIAAGNGGSLADAVHFTEELTGFYRSRTRRAFEALALAEPSFLTCVGNDVSFDQVFARGLEAYGKKGDLFFALTTSGNSPNILAALAKAKERGLQTIALLGKTGGKAKGMADIELIIEGFSTSDRIQEAHMVVLHILVELMEISITC
jgi:D-sedoheptulose 7-phosphate isomerase